MKRQTANEVEIYGLFNAAGELRYIGKAICAKKRFNGHLREIRRRTPLYDWLKGLRRKGESPMMKVLETVPVEDWERSEKQWIFESRLRGDRLLNLAPGGDQPFVSRETRSANAKALNMAIGADPRRAVVRSVKQSLARALKAGGVSKELRDRIKQKAVRCPQILGTAAAIILSQEAENV